MYARTTTRAYLFYWYTILSNPNTILHSTLTEKLSREGSRDVDVDQVWEYCIREDILPCDRKKYSKTFKTTSDFVNIVFNAYI